jgi:NADPH:quinone reductase
MSELRNRVVQVRPFGGPDGLEVVDAPLPTAGWGGVRVRVLASGLEYTDVSTARKSLNFHGAQRVPVPRPDHSMFRCAPNQQ